MLLENENLMNYEAEKNFILSPYNKSSFYIPGKGITLDENGNIRFFPLDDINDFVYGQDIEPEILFDEYQLTNKEKELIKKLQNANGILNPQGLSAIYMREEKNHLFIFLTVEDNPEIFYKIPAEDIDKVNRDELPSISPNTLEKALYIEF